MSEQKKLIHLDGKKIDISGPGGNAFALLGKVQSFMKQCDVSKEDIAAFRECAMSSDYDHLCKTVTEATGIELTMGNDSEYL